MPLSVRLTICAVVMVLIGCERSSSETDSGAGGGEGTGGGGGGGAVIALPDIAASTLELDRVSGVLADGQDQVVATVTLKSSDGLPTPGIAVTLSATGSANTFTAAGLTDADGIARAQLTSTRAESKILSATFSTAQGALALTQQPEVRFVAGPAVRLLFQASPTSSTAGATLTPEPQVSAEDAQGNPVDGLSVTLTLGGGSTGAPLVGPITSGMDAGLASFPGLTVERAGAGYLLLASAGAAAGSSAPFGITAGAPVAIEFLTQPTVGVAGEPLSPAFEVVVRDAFANLAPTPPTTLSLALATGALQGATTLTTDGGWASFSGLTIERAAIHTVLATAPLLPSAASAPLTIQGGAPSFTQSLLEANPTQVLADGLTSTTLTATVRDAFQNPLPGLTVELRGVAPDGGLTVTQPASSTSDAGVTTGSAVCSQSQEVSFELLVDGGVLAPAVTVTFTECEPTTTATCYPGPSGTLGQGPCHAGTKTCDSTGAWGSCLGAVVPVEELCANNIDEDCTGVADDVADVDGDGWTRCSGDCCELTADCSVPAAVNPGALEVRNNAVDDDCDAATLDTAAEASCSNAAKFTGVTATDFANALDLCQVTTANPPLAQKKWGLLSASQRLADGSTPSTTVLAEIQNYQTAIMTLFGTTNTPRKGTTLAALSTGRARDSNDADFVNPNPGTNFARTIAFPGNGPLATYLNAHGGVLPAGRCGATTCPPGTGAYDSVNVRLQLRVPTNAYGFSYDFRFFSSEYQTYQCTAYNDSYLAMLTSSVAGLPADHQISFDPTGARISVNSSFLTVCPGNGKNCNSCPSGTADLGGTGYDVNNVGAATNWLTSDVPVVPGETITLEFLLFDVSDGISDTSVLFDNFRWSITPVVAGTH